MRFPPVAAAAVLAAALAASLAAGCGVTRSLTATDLRVGVATGFPPVVYEEGGELRGLEIDLARALAAELNLRIEFVRMEFPRLIPALVRGDIDVVMSGMSATAERARTVSFTRPWLRAGQRALLRAVDAPGLGTLPRLLAARSAVGFEAGTTGEMFCRARLRNARLLPFPTAEAGIAALRAGDVDWFVHDAPTAWAAASGPLAAELAVLPEPLTEEHFAWAVRPWEDELRERLDAVLLEWEEDGTLRRILEARLGPGAGDR